MKSQSLLPITAQNASGAEVKISSIEIAELCEKQHKNVIVDIRKMLAELKLNSADFSAQYQTKDGRMQPCYFLPKRETMILVSGYRIDLRAKIIDRLDELEKQHQPSIPKNYPEALRMAAELAEQNQVLLLEKQQTTAENHALKSYFEPGLTPAQFVKGLNGVNSNKINDYLRSRGWLYKDKHCWRVFSHVRDKYLTESFKRIEVDPVERIEMATYKPILLEKGAVKIFEAYLQGKLPMKADWNGKYYHSKVAV
ncbi:TPA: Rha family transcriptional regulator [Mannheimia haemolytica]|uniref:Rha family transcriptional regulator n=1 Tax=Mannheimia haemolytica TaxID=75985 RepID=UPI0001594C04|nr:Rha family transcriptional regulator [Mannheimia haemolytica]AWW71175.1 phage regulatory protein/antirepressor Ant [Pasteurellaceae bacterium 12565]AGI32293.1 phage regulatory protein/antirepressor Ant [Mannheimia haemolytica USDA-ARS-USMARC-183]AGK02138.1 putative bacteriophage regulatory protein Rha [Mannheimia haemolytica M42548]AGQ24386.1 phage antirepressor [Mannheimia haemolytica D153]AGQ39921.1 phage antirepressor [Mannheimia haemolytica D174]